MTPNQSKSFSSTDRTERRASKFDPRLTRTSVVMKYTADDGYRYELIAKAGKGSVNHNTGQEVPPQQALLDALQELARITALFGYEKEAQQVFEDARIAVFEWLGRRPSAQDAAEKKATA